MTEEEKEPKKRASVIENLSKDEQIKKGLFWANDNRLFLVAAILMIVGIILTFSFYYVGGFFVGLALGMAFYQEIEGFFKRVRTFYPAHGLYKTLMLVGGALFLLITLPLFLVALLLGYAISYIIRKISR